MKRSICTFAMIPVRSAPAEGAEMVTQILFGETYDVYETVGRWSRIVTVDDSYPGWIDAKLVTEVSEEEVEMWSDANGKFVTYGVVNEIEDLASSPVDFQSDLTESQLEEENRKRIQAYELQNSLPAFIPMGSVLFGVNFPMGDPSMEENVTKEERLFRINGHELRIFQKDSSHRPCTPVECARRLLGAPYLWGGRTVFGIDCSGLVQLAYKVCHIQLPRDASQMVKIGAYVSIGEQKENDLAFFANESGHITHVGLCLDDGRIIHASGCVRIDMLDSQGIFNKARECHTHKLACIKRLWNNDLN